MPSVSISDVGPGELDRARCLFREYAAPLGHCLCFQSFEKELAELPGVYAAPGGCLLMACVDGEPAGCVALRPLASDAGEMKRLYVRPGFRGLGLGRALVDALLERARAIGYCAIRLDTLPTMQSARRLYVELGFRKIPPYMPEPIPEAICMELTI